MKIIWTKGVDLTPEQRVAALAAYPHRWTGDHCPTWHKPLGFEETGRNPTGLWQHRGPVPWPPFDTDSEWLDAHCFAVVADAAGFTTYTFAPGKRIRKI